LKALRVGSAMRSQHRPQADISRSYAVGVVAVAAFLAAEVQAVAIGRQDEPALRATPASVFRIHELHTNANRSGFVCDKELSFCIRPTMDLGAEVFSLTQRSVSDIAEVFQAERSCTVSDRVGHQLFACPMEQGYRYGCFVAAHAPEKTPRTTSANGLDSRTFAADAGTAMVFHPSLEKECSVICRIGGDHQALDTEVHADNATLGLGLRNLDLMRETQEPHFANALELGVLPSTERDGAMRERCGLPENSHSLSISSEVASVGDGHDGSYVNAPIPSVSGHQSLVAGRHLTEQRTGQLGWQPELLSNDSIVSARQAIGVQFLRLKNLFGYPAGRSEIATGYIIQVLRFTDFAFDCAKRLQYT